ncbi:PIR Superfamily Protein [Plasmodium ovale wallikeri]|uniref:PIR Superfamily Protein n=1 Tax=Plasmodium ovale wallikeri TaxID=864142 RepID=A0A1A9AS00_PLAOA|nr:PIR Superfamily Protein [Plasmodium ovale wallikeri]
MSRTYLVDDILKETSSYKLYKEFETKVEAETDNEYCKGIFKEENKYQVEGIEICKKIINNFKKLYNNEINIKTDNSCLHYKNWVYHEIWKLIISKSEQGNAKEIINKFLDIQKGKNVYSSDSKKVCHYYFVFSDFIELNSKKEEKDLRDYFKYYHTIYENISPHASDKEKYKKYIQYIYELYKRHKIDWKCCDESYGVDPLCRHYFKCEEEYNPSDLLEILNGAKKEDIKKKYKTPPVVLFGEEKLTGDLKEEDVMRIQYGRCTKIYYPEDREKVFALRCDYKASNDHFGKFSNNLPDGKEKDNEKDTTSTSISPVNLSNFSDMSNVSEEESNPVYYKIPTSVALGLGTAFVFFLYYKFTPFGSLFGKRGRGGRNFEDDFNEEYMQEFPYDSEYEDVNMRNRRIQIAYQGA